MVLFQFSWRRGSKDFRGQRAKRKKERGKEELGKRKEERGKGKGKGQRSEASQLKIENLNCRSEALPSIINQQSSIQNRGSGVPG